MSVVRRFCGGRGFASAFLLGENASKAGSVKETLELINQMRAEGIVGDYAIGGAVGATFYLAPAATVDLDVFAKVPSASAGSLVSLSPIYEYLKSQGATVQDEYIMVGGWPVQFLLPSDALETEAIDQAVRTDVEGVPTRVMSAEHLMAIALKTGRAKDHNRILQFMEQASYEPARLRAIIERHGLSEKWQNFEKRFLEDSR